jgi:hypothetical protein
LFENERNPAALVAVPKSPETGSRQLRFTRTRTEGEGAVGVGASEGVPVGEVVTAGEAPDGVNVDVDPTPEGARLQPATSTAIAPIPTICFSEDPRTLGNNLLMLI